MRSALKRFVQTAVKDSALLVDRVRPPEPGITILIYHRVGSGSGGEMDIAPGVFRDQMRSLRDTQRLLSLDQAADELSSGQVVEPGVVVTFDDGTADWVDHVLPIIDECSIPTTFYVATKFIDDHEPFPQDGRPISWAGLHQLASHELVTIGSHTHRHLVFDRLDPRTASDELRVCDELIEDHLGLTPTHFCYPKALPPSPDCAELVRRRYRTAVLAGTRANPSGSDLQRLARTPIQASDRGRHVRAKIAGGMGSEDRLRSVANRRRYRGVTT